MAMRRLSCRDKMFQCRARASEDQVESAKLACGFAVFLAPGASLGLFAVHSAQFLLPLLALAALVTCASLTMTFIVVCDLLGQQTRAFSVWQREALGRLLRNFLMGLLVTLSLLSAHLSLDGSLRLRTSTLSALLPGLVTAGLGLLKVLAVHSEHSCYWGGLFSLGLVQGLLVVSKVDYGFQFPWSLAIGPMYLFCLSTCAILAEEEAALWRLALQVSACLLCGASGLLGALAGDTTKEAEAEELRWTSLGLAAGCWLAFALGSCGVCGSYVLDIFWGHIEMDFNYHQSPVLLKRMHTF